MLRAHKPHVHYGRPQLREVICQLRFPAILSIGSHEPADFQEAIRQAGELQSEIYKGLGVLPAEQLLGLCCRCISAMTGEDTLTRKFEKEYGGKDDDHDS